MSIGAALTTVPLLTWLRPASIVTGIAVGAIVIALGIAGTDTQGRGTLPMSAQAAGDRGLALGLLLIGVLFAEIGDHASVALFGGAGLVTLLLTLTTRYSTQPL